MEVKINYILNTYIIFLYGDFDDFEDMEFFCLNVLGDSKKINEIKYIIQSLNNVIVILDSDFDKNSLHEELVLILNNPNINFYFIFDRKNVFAVYLPDKMKDIIFKPKQVIIETEQKEKDLLDLDEILDKIDKHGVDILSKNEKNFLDNFGL